MRDERGCALPTMLSPRPTTVRVRLAPVSSRPRDRSRHPAAARPAQTEDIPDAMARSAARGPVRPRRDGSRSAPRRGLRAPPDPRAVGMSFFRIELLRDEFTPFIGFRNYAVRLAADSGFLGTLPLTLGFAILTSALAVPLALATAMLIDGRGRFAGAACRRPPPPLGDRPDRRRDPVEADVRAADRHGHVPADPARPAAGGDPRRVRDDRRHGRGSDMAGDPAPRDHLPRCPATGADRRLDGRQRSTAPPASNRSDTSPCRRSRRSSSPRASSRSSSRSRSSRSSTRCRPGPADGIHAGRTRDLQHGDRGH